MACLVLIDFVAALAASRTVVTLLDEADAGFWDQRVFGSTISAFALVANVGVPLMWMTILAAAGAYDRRALGRGTEELKRVVRANVAMAATVSFLALGFKKDLSRATVAAIILCLLFYALVSRAGARSCSDGSAGSASGRHSGCCWSGGSPTRWPCTRW